MYEQAKNITDIVESLSGVENKELREKMEKIAEKINSDIKSLAEKNEELFDLYVKLIKNSFEE